MSGVRRRAWIDLNSKGPGVRLIVVALSIQRRVRIVLEIRGMEKIPKRNAAVFDDNYPFVISYNLHY
jgi:hypothetical protein